MNRNHLLFTLLISCMYVLATAQSVSFSDVIDLEYRNSGYIYENEQIKGYYFFHKLDKASKNEYTYQVKILDENMREAISTTIVRPESFYLSEAVFNGQAFLFRFFDDKAQIMEFVSFNRQGEQMGIWRSEKMRKRELYYYSYVGSFPGFTDWRTKNGVISPVGDRGFLVVFHFLAGSFKVGTSTMYFPNDLSAANRWSDRSPPKKPISDL